MKTDLFRAKLTGAAWTFALLMTSLLSVQADMIWHADFESYDTSGGSAALNVNSTGAYDTFTSTTSSGLNSSTADVRSISSLSPLPTNATGNVLYISGTNTSGAASSATFRVFQNAITSLSSGAGVLVISFDLWNVDRTETVPIDASTTGGRYGSTISLSSIAKTQAYRVTLVVNRSGSSITLPDAGGTSLATNSIASYWYDGTNFSTAQTNSGGFSPIVSGFGIGESLSNLPNNGSLITAFDNFGAWNSLTDTINGTSVLSLAPGTVVPEPSTHLLVLLSTALLLGVNRRRARASTR